MKMMLKIMIMDNDNDNENNIFNLDNGPIKSKSSDNNEKKEIEETYEIINNSANIKEEKTIDKKNTNEETTSNYYYYYFDYIQNRCFINCPKNMFIKNIFSHIYYNLLFYDKAFMYIKYKYLREFPTTNSYSKQLNYPSKIKNFSNIYEPKLFLNKDFYFYDKPYFQISYDFLFFKSFKDLEIDEIKEKKIASLINSNISLVTFYKHDFYLNEIMQEQDKYFDCELITLQYTYFGFIIFGKNFIYFGTKDENPPVYDKKKIEQFKLEYFLQFCFGNRSGENITDKKKSIILFYPDIKLIIKRRILLMYQSIEIFCRNGKSYFLNFYNKKKCNDALKILNDIKNNLNDKNKFGIINEITNLSEEMKKINNDVKNRNITNYLYLLKINCYSSRTYNDTNQYPIFPWIILDFGKLPNLINAEKNNIGKYEGISTITSISTINEEDNENTTDDTTSKDANQKLYNECGLRIFKYPLSMQLEKKRQKVIEQFVEEKEENKDKFIHHHGAHYSTSSYVYYFLMRNNPYTQCIIKLQNYTKENPNRLFISYKETLKVFKSIPENRELIPDLFCHFDFYSNLNCTYNGHKTIGNLIVDDLYGSDNEYTENMLSIYLKYVYLFRKLLNSNLVSKYLPDWIDNIFGKNQIPEPKKIVNSCNTFNKSSYEEKMKLDEKINKYKEKYDNKEITKKELASKILVKIDLLNNFGVTPHKVLENTIKIKTTLSTNNIPNIYFNINTNIYFIKNNEQIFILFKDYTKESNKIKKIAIWNGTKEKKKIISCGDIKRLKKIEIEDKNSNNHKIPIFKPCYSMAKFILNNKLFILTCRYLGNIFKVQNTDYCIDVLCEDFVNCIICKENIESNYDDIIFYTGLKNGKLIQWYIEDNLNKPEKIKITEKRSRHCHKGAITCIELYQNQNIIITGGEDKMVFIRKTYDFELLTAINLIYLYCNPIISQKFNIIPTMIKVSELNCIYIIIYNYETRKSFIRGYNLNGLFFAQSDEKDFMNICFTKNSNLLVSFYNLDNISILNCYDLQSVDFDLKPSEFLIKNNKNKKSKGKTNNDSLVWFNYNYNKKEFILLFEEQIFKGCLGQEKQIKLDFY